ncbi:MAG: BlaI/MecI/CopY family transcriptional regulator [Gemmatimonadetes bacterium]|nr:BlaI/MecI/CopY family transcriptional regulator [Gemmatimonadota bacterium]MCC6769848.1 BlaI/MecI/CopY family transcriptional regulator [Gemmatimonadaceae bacterium]
MAKPSAPSELSRRERQVMNILHRRGPSTVSEIMDELPDPPTYSAVRSILRILAEKDVVRYREDGPRYVYIPAESAEQSQESALAHLVETYFAGSTEQAITALLRLGDADIAEQDIERLRAQIRTARDGGR